MAGQRAKMLPEDGETTTGAQNHPEWPKKVLGRESSEKGTHKVRFSQCSENPGVRKRHLRNPRTWNSEAQVPLKSDLNDI